MNAAEEKTKSLYESFGSLSKGFMKVPARPKPVMSVVEAFRKQHGVAGLRALAVAAQRASVVPDEQPPETPPENPKRPLRTVWKRSVHLRK